MKLNYIIIGVQKSGTTSCIDIFNQHQNIYLYKNELHYFDKEPYKKNNIKNFECNFKTKKKKIGIKTPSYCYLRYSLNRIYDIYPKIKLIIILREPIQRAFSQYNMDLNRNRIPEDKTFLDSIKEIENIKLEDISKNNYFALQRGFYFEQINYIYSKFPKENLYIAISEELKENPKSEYNKIFNFLGEKDIEVKICINFITDYKRTLDNESKKYLYNIYKSHNEKLYKLLGRKINKWEKFYKTFL